MTDTVQLALISGAFTFAAIALNRILSYLESRRTNLKIDSVKADIQVAQKIVRSDIKDVHEEVKTANGRTLGEFADITETRRIEKVPLRDRTDAEKEHMQSKAGELPPADSHQGP